MTVLEMKESNFLRRIFVLFMLSPIAFGYATFNPAGAALTNRTSNVNVDLAVQSYAKHVAHKKRQDNPVPESSHSNKDNLNRQKQNYLVIKSFASSKLAKSFVDGEFSEALSAIGRPAASGDVCFVRTRATGLRWHAVVASNFFDNLGVAPRKIQQKIGIRPWSIEIDNSAVRCDRKLVVDVYRVAKHGVASKYAESSKPVFKAPIIRVGHEQSHDDPTIAASDDMGSGIVPMVSDAVSDAPIQASVETGRTSSSIRFEQIEYEPSIEQEDSFYTPSSFRNHGVLDTGNADMPDRPVRWDYGQSGSAFTAGLPPSDFIVDDTKDSGVCRQMIQIPSEKFAPTRVIDYVYRTPDGTLCDLMYVVNTQQGDYL